MKRRIIAVSWMIAFLLSSCAAGSPTGGKQEGVTQARSTQVQGKPQSAKSAQTEASSEPKSQSTRIEVNWESSYELDVSLKGESEDGEALLITKDDTEITTREGDLVAEVECESTQSKHRVTFVVHKLDTHLELEAVNGPDNQMPESLEAEVFLSGSDSPVHFDNQDGAGTYRSYTGVWFWAPFGLDHGKLVDYDASWIEEGSGGQDPEEGEAENPSDGDEQKALNQLEQAKSLSFDDKIELIRWVYYDIQGRLDELEREDGGSGTTRFLEDGMIRKIVAEPGTYEGHDDDCTAEFYYLNNVPLFAFVYGDGEEHRFYLDPGEMGECIRYIDEEGEVHDYPRGGIPDGETELDYYCSMAFMELHWAGVLK